MPHIHIEPDAENSFTLSYNGRKVLREESYQVASNVMDFLLHPDRMDGSECAEVARSILYPENEGPNHPRATGEFDEDDGQPTDLQEHEDFAQDDLPEASEMLGADDV